MLKYRWAYIRLILFIILVATPAFGAIAADLPLTHSVFPLDNGAHQAKWKVTSGTLGQSFVPASKFPANSQTAYFISTAGADPAALNTGRTGTVVSPPFEITERFYALLAGGGNHNDQTFVAVRDAATQHEYWRSPGNNSSKLTVTPIDLSRGIGRSAVVVVEDNALDSNGYVLFGGLFHTDQEAALDDLVLFHINLLLFNRSRADGERWLSQNLHERHTPLIRDSLLQRRNTPLIRILVSQSNRFPSPVLVPGLLHVATQYDEQTARYACAAIGEMSKHIDPMDLPNVESSISKLMNRHESPDLRIVAAGTLTKIGTSTSLAAVQAAASTQPPPPAKVAEGLRFLINSKNFTNTQFARPAPGKHAECWLRGMQYYVYLPRQWTSDKEWPLLIGCHGTWGHGALYAELMQSECNRLGAVGIAPTFDPHRFWGFGHFGGKWRPDLALIEVIQRAREPLRLQNMPCVMFGQSEGSQFVSRFVLVHPKGVARAAISATDELVTPDPTIPFPYGLGPNPAMPDLQSLSADAWLEVPFFLIVGTADHKADISLSQKWAEAVNAYAKRTGHRGSVTFIPHHGGQHSLGANYPYMQSWISRGFGL